MGLAGRAVLRTGGLPGGAGEKNPPEGLPTPVQSLVCRDMSLEVLRHELPPIGTNCLLVPNPERGELAVFDAPLNAWATVEREAVRRGLRISGLYFTHGHWDHTLDGTHFIANGVPTWAHEAERIFFEKPEIMAALSIPGLDIPRLEIDNWLQHGATLEIVGRPVEVRHVPGHSQGSLLFWFREDGFAITGDAIFRGSIGRTDFPGCSFEELAESIRKQVYTLPDDTILYPGHGPQTSVGREACSNPFVSRSDER